VLIKVESGAVLFDENVQDLLLKKKIIYCKKNYCKKKIKPNLNL
jgi:hypothetical protein